MADKKISALTSATTPLAGTEVLPIVQSSATVKVAVSDLTAGRAVSAASLTLTTPLAVANGGTGITSFGNGVATALGVNTGTAGAFVVNGGALGSPSTAGTMPAFTLGGTVSGGGNQINNVVIGTTTPLAGAFTTLSSASNSSTATGLSLTNVQTNNGYNQILLQGSGGSNIYGVALRQSTTNTAVHGGDFDLLCADSSNVLTSRIRVVGSNGTIAVTGALSTTGVVTFSNYGAGSATFSASGVISSVSDETWKIKDGIPTNPDAMLKKLEPGYWYYNDERKETFGVDRQLGFYAQNVNAAIGPEAAPTPEESKPWGYYDRSVLAVTVMSLQKALATIESLTARITALEAR